MTTEAETLNGQLDDILQHLYGFLPVLGAPSTAPLAEWVMEEVKSARWAEPDDYGLNFKRTAIRAFEETRYYATFVKVA